MMVVGTGDNSRTSLGAVSLPSIFFLTGLLCVPRRIQKKCTTLVLGMSTVSFDGA